VTTRLLEALAKQVPEASEHYLFAHRHLAELKLESSPWPAALHLRRCIRWQPRNDSLHALMGLAQALLGNYRTAIESYRRAVRLSPENPWYRHNLGHLLDVALAAPNEAFEHLEAARGLEPSNHEITASLAHCLAGMGRMQDAAELASLAEAMAPDHAEHGALSAWIRNRQTQVRDADSTVIRPTEKKPFTKVAETLERTMRKAGYSAVMIEAALDLWDEYWLKSPNLRIRKPGAVASAIEYAVVHSTVHRPVSQREVAERYSVSVAALRGRLRSLRSVLNTSGGPLEQHIARRLV